MIMGVKLELLALVLGILAIMVSKTMQLNMDHPLYGAIKKVNDQAQANGTAIIGLILTSKYDEKQLLASGYFVPDYENPFVPIAGRTYHIGRFNKSTIAVYVLAGEPLAGVSVTVQVMLDNFKIAAIISTGSAASLVVDDLRIGDVAVVTAATYTTVWKWQAWKDKSSVSLSSNITLTFGDYNVPKAGENELGSIDFKPVTRYSPFGPSKKKVFWFPVPPVFKRLSSKLVDVELESCYDENNCVNGKPKVVLGLKAGSSDVFLLNKAYGNFLHNKGDLSLVDRQSAAVGSTAYANGVPYAVFRGATNTLEGPSDKKMVALASKNSLKVAATFVDLVAGELSASVNHYSDV